MEEDLYQEIYRKKLKKIKMKKYYVMDCKNQHGSVFITPEAIYIDSV
jgi:hypothetical protein